MSEYEKPTAPLLAHAPPAHNPEYQPHGFNQQYQPAPPAYTQQPPPQPMPGYYGAAPTSTTTTNVVVVGQPGPTPVMVPMAPRAPDYMGFSICTLVLCLICGGLPFLLCAIVALVFSLKAQDHNKSGDYEAARSSGKFALGFNILAFVSGPIVYIAVVIILIIYYSVYYASLNASRNY